MPFDVGELRGNQEEEVVGREVGGRDRAVMRLLCGIGGKLP